MTESTAAAPAWADSKHAWLGRVHDAVLPSGIKVTYRDLTLGEMAALGELPGDLLELVVAEWASPGAMRQLAAAPYAALPARPSKKQEAAAEAKVREVAVRIAAVNRHMIAAALVEPALTVEELERVPMADLELLSALINRNEYVDAAGRDVGVVPVDQFQVVLAAHGHQPCAPGCPTCETARRTLATAR